jgi:hypothetical protein
LPAWTILLKKPIEGMLITFESYSASASSVFFEPGLNYRAGKDRIPEMWRRSAARVLEENNDREKMGTLLWAGSL